MRRGGMGAIASSPTMVGAITTLIVILAIFLAYNANNGLPFVPSYRISVQVPNAETLVKGNDVRVAGIRVGFVESVVPVAHENGKVTAQANLKLDKSVDPIPRGSTISVRSRSALGLKYLDIKMSHSPRGYPEGSTLPLAAARPHPVQFDQLLNTFNTPTRVAIKQNLVQFGAALGGRGPQLNEAFGALRPLLARLRPVAKNLGSQQTGLVRFFRAAEDLSAEVLPVAETQAHMFVSLDTAFAAFASVARPFIQETISETPPTLDTLTRTSPKIESLLAHSAGLFADLRPGVHALRVNSPAIASALETGARVLPDTPELNAQLPPTAQSLERFATDRGVQAGINRSTQLANYLTPTARFVGPAQSICNYGTLLFRNAESVFSIGDNVGTSQRFIVLSSPGGPNNETSPSSAPANQAGNEDNPFNGDPNANFLHSNPYPNTASPGQTFECEAGNEPYTQGRATIGNVPGNQGIKTEDQLPRQLNARRPR